MITPRGSTCSIHSWGIDLAQAVAMIAE